MKNFILITALMSMFAFEKVAAQNPTLEVNLDSEDDISVLYWNTHTEVNSNYFLIESSKDNKIFKVISTIKAAGYSVTTKEYKFEVEPEYMGQYLRVTLISMEGERNSSIAVQRVNETENGLLTRK